MGGFGSGRYGYSTTAKLDEGLTLNINRLIRQGQIGRSSLIRGTLTWTRVYSGDYVASIGYECNTLNPDDMWFRVHYTQSNYRDEDKVKRDYKIKLVTTTPNYGGERLWFQCPITGDRAAVLHSTQGSKWFACRNAYNLKYKSQSKSAHDRAIDRMWKLKNKLGGEYYYRPKGMHQKTYERLLDELHAAEEEVDRYLAMFVFGRFGKQLGL